MFRKQTNERKEKKIMTMTTTTRGKKTLSRTLVSFSLWEDCLAWKSAVELVHYNDEPFKVFDDCCNFGYSTSGVHIVGLSWCFSEFRLKSTKANKRVHGCFNHSSNCSWQTIWLHLDARLVNKVDIRFLFTIFIEFVRCYCIVRF